MSSEVKKFFVKLSLVAIGLVVAGFIAFKWFLFDYYLPVYWIALIFFFVFTFFTHAWQVNTARKDMAKFTRLNMVATLMKLMVYAGFVVVYLAISAEKAIAFVVVIMVIYIFFTFIEVTSLTKYARNLTQNRE